MWDTLNLQDSPRNVKCAPDKYLDFTVMVLMEETIPNIQEKLLTINYLFLLQLVGVNCPLCMNTQHTHLT